MTNLNILQKLFFNKDKYFYGLNPQNTDVLNSNIVNSNIVNNYSDIFLARFAQMKLDNYSQLFQERFAQMKFEYYSDLFHDRFLALKLHNVNNKLLITQEQFDSDYLGLKTNLKNLTANPIDPRPSITLNDIGTHLNTIIGHLTNLLSEEQEEELSIDNSPEFLFRFLILYRDEFFWAFPMFLQIIITNYNLYHEDSILTLGTFFNNCSPFNHYFNLGGNDFHDIIFPRFLFVHSADMCVFKNHMPSRTITNLDPIGNNINLSNFNIEIIGIHDIRAYLVDIYLLKQALIYVPAAEAFENIRDVLKEEICYNFGENKLEFIQKYQDKKISFERYALEMRQWEFMDLELTELYWDWVNLPTQIFELFNPLA